MNKNNHDKKEQEELCKEFILSGLSRKEFSNKHNISTKTLSRWLSTKKKASESKLKFLPIGTIGKGKPVILSIALSNGIKLTVNIETSAISELIKDLI